MAGSLRQRSSTCDAGWDCLDEGTRFGIALVLGFVVLALVALYWYLKARSNRLAGIDEERADPGEAGAIALVSRRSSRRASRPPLRVSRSPTRVSLTITVSRRADPPSPTISFASSMSAPKKKKKKKKKKKAKKNQSMPTTKPKALMMPEHIVQSFLLLHRRRLFWPQLLLQFILLSNKVMVFRFSSSQHRPRLSRQWTHISSNYSIPLLLSQARFTQTFLQTLLEAINRLQQTVISISTSKPQIPPPHRQPQYSRERKRIHPLWYLRPKALLVLFLIQYLLDIVSIVECVERFPTKEVVFASATVKLVPTSLSLRLSLDLGLSLSLEADPKMPLNQEQRSLLGSRGHVLTEMPTLPLGRPPTLLKSHATFGLRHSVEPIQFEALSALRENAVKRDHGRTNPVEEPATDPLMPRILMVSHQIVPVSLPVILLPPVAEHPAIPNTYHRLAGTIREREIDSPAPAIIRMPRTMAHALRQRAAAETIAQSLRVASRTTENGELQDGTTLTPDTPAHGRGRLANREAETRDLTNNGTRMKDGPPATGQLKAAVGNTDDRALMTLKSHLSSPID
ncbi:hypothetical protein B0T22DRAFT_486578 [Podospora appendiculata]|uniref:Uncharacterized protein n=1 Tax=Podospora appendiculata TaxID=314037 RepID=A0AAE0XFZ6_9PEZI|nr:hypothetical protein B0T22DRAFT_486578 [Podospora appendiculata]